MNRSGFLSDTPDSTAETTPPSPNPGVAQPGPHSFSHHLPASDGHYQRVCGYIEDDPVAAYEWASPDAYEAFLDMKFGIRVVWGVYSRIQLQNESWPFLEMSLGERQAYQDLYKSWYPAGFDADEWVDFFAESGAKMFAFTTKHHDGFSMYDTKTRIRRRPNWLAPGGPVIEDCDIAYSIMETPFKRDVVKELTEAAHKKGLKTDLYFSHPDWYDADFRPYNFHPLQIPDAGKIAAVGKDLHPEMEHPEKRFGKSGLVVVPDPGPVEIDRMMKRHRAQLEELITGYGNVDMVCLDQWLGPQVWPQLRETMLYLRKIRPDVMYRARGIGNYGDYYTPEGFVPGNKENTDVPWFVIYPLGKSFSYDPREENYKGAAWIVRNLIDSAAKGGNFMASIGPDGSGRFHPKAIEQLKQTGEWLRVNGKGIYGTRARDGQHWKQGDEIRFTTTKDKKHVFAFVFDRPGSQLILASVRPRRGSEIRLMGIPTPLKWRYSSNRGLIIEIPEELLEKLPSSIRMAYGFEIEVS